MTIELKMPESNRSDAGIPKAILYTQTIGNINATAGIKPRTKKVAEDQTKDKLKGAIVVKKVMDKKKFKLAVGVRRESSHLINRPIPEHLRQKYGGSLSEAFKAIDPTYDKDFKAIHELRAYLENAIRDRVIEKSEATLSVAIMFLDMLSACGIGDDSNTVAGRLTEPAIRIAKKTQAQVAAKNLRGAGKALTIEIVADRLNKSTTEKRDAVIAELATEFEVHKRTVERRIKSAVDRKLLP